MQYDEKNNNDAKKQRFYTHVVRVYDAALRFMNRAKETVLANGKEEMAQGLSKLLQNVLGNLFEETIVTYYVLQHMVGGTSLRTLERLDYLLYPFIENEDAEYVKALVFNFVKEIDTLKVSSNIPFVIGGTDANSNSSVDTPLDTEFTFDDVASAIEILKSYGLNAVNGSCEVKIISDQNNGIEDTF